MILNNFADIREKLMNQAPPLQLMIKGATRMLPFERVALVLQGGGALGAYQAGVYQAIHEANIDVHWICGTSIGGINGALIAGNPPEQRVERLRDFWKAVTKPPIRIAEFPLVYRIALERQRTRAPSGPTRSARLPPCVHGAPDFFSPRPFPPLRSAAESPEAKSATTTRRR